MTTQHRRLSLWKRALLHGLKTLVRRHPGAALHAAGATVAYAGREVVHDGADFMREKIEDAGHAIGEHGSAHTELHRPTGGRGKPKADKRELSKQESTGLLEKLSTEERRALTRLGSNRRS